MVLFDCLKVKSKKVGTWNTSIASYLKQFRYKDGDLNCSLISFVTFCHMLYFIEFGARNRNKNFPEIIAINYKTINNNRK